MKEASPEEFGCEHCWPASAEAADEALNALVQTARLVGESHFGVSIRTCWHCAQAFLQVFTETIDWVDGEDPQSTTVLPLTRDEASRLVARADDPGEGELNALGPERRSFRCEFPKGEERRVFWGRGLRVGPHD
jgi:hypothetical protein